MSSEDLLVVNENGKEAHTNGSAENGNEEHVESASTSNGSDNGVKRTTQTTDEDAGSVIEPPKKKAKVEDEEEGEGDEVEEKEEEEKKEQPSPVPDDPHVQQEKSVEEEKKKTEQSNGGEKKEEKKKDTGKKEPELTSSEALLDKLETYVNEAMEKNENVERKVLDALLGAINIQVQREPLSVRKLILEKQLVLPNTISFPPSQVVDLLIEHDPDHPLQKVIQKMFPDQNDRPKYSESEKKERANLKANFGAPHMTKLLMEIGQDLVQEATYCDIVHARNLPEVPKNIETYKQVAAQLKPVWESLRKKNEPYKMKLLTCQLCGYRTESRIVMIQHRSQPHHDGKKYQCTMCPEFDTNESRIMAHYIEAHDVIPLKEEAALRNPCYICEEDFQLKGQREAHLKMCKRDYHRLRHIMSPKNPDDMCMINRWLWDKPPLDPTILAQQQVAQQQQQKQQRAAQLAAAQATQAARLAAAHGGKNSSPLTHANLQQAALLQQQQQLLAQQRLRTQLAAAAQQQHQQQPGGTPRAQNSLIAAMQQHLARAATAAAGRGGGVQQQQNQALANAALIQKAAQAQAQAQAVQKAMALNLAKQMQMQNGNQQRGVSSSPATSTPNRLPSSISSTPTSTPALMQCEICDHAVSDKDRYLAHLQQQHKQMKGKTSSDMAQGAPLACSRCRDRFWTYEGLERHLVMSHGLVTSDLLQKAQRKEDGGRCKICGKQYAFNMLQHLVADHQVKLCSAEIMYSCDVCAFKCQSYQKLEHHLTTNHPKNGTPASAPSAATPAAKPAAAAGAAECITLDD